MSDQHQFPPLPQSRLTRGEIVDYLLEQRRRGYEVYQDPQHPNVLMLILDEGHRIKFAIDGSDCQLQAELYGALMTIANVSGVAELRGAVDSMAENMLGPRWLRGVDRARLNQNHPATNFASIATLIGGSTVEAVFDPYLENRSLTSLIDILSFGAGSVAGGVRVLGTSKTTGGQLPKLTRVGFDAWLTQLRINGELRLMDASEHRRFLLLSGGQSLLLGHSLNALHKNEAIRLEPDTEDRAFFDAVWAKAVSFQ